MKNRRKEIIKRDPFYKKILTNIGLAKTMLIAWIFLVVFSGIALAGFTTTLTVDSTATIQKHIYDYVYISHVEISGSSSGTNMYYSFKDHEIKPTTSISTCNGYVEYALTIVNTTAYPAYITATNVESMINGNGNSSSSMSVEFTDVTANSTYIEPHSTKIIHVRVKNNCTGSDSLVTSTINFTYSLYKFYNLTIVSDQSDSTITMTTKEGTFTGTGTLTHALYEDDTASYTVSKTHYYDSTGSYSNPTADHTINVTMQEDPRRDVTFTPSASSATVTVKDSSGNVVSPSSGTTYILNKGSTYTYVATEPEYYDASGSYTVTDSDGQTVTITMTERPWITGTISNSDRTTAATKTDTNYHAGYYLIEVWGGSAGDGKGNYAGDAGSAGYVYGVVYISYNSTVYSTAGGSGTANTSSATGGANGGGAAGSDSSNPGGSGGGYSAFVVGATTVDNSSYTSSQLKLLAGGAGGGAGAGGAIGQYRGGEGGDGGTLSSTSSSVSTGTVYHGTDGDAGSSSTAMGKGGTTSGGSSEGNYATAGSFLTGGAAKNRGGGGGAGLFGGGGGAGDRRIGSAYYGPGAGGGGSSYLQSDVSTSVPSSVSLTGTNPSSTGGAVIIKWIGKTL